MSRVHLDQILAEIRAKREQMLAVLNDVTEDEFSIPTGIERWTEVRRLLLRFGDHMREHVSQIEGIRTKIGRPPTMAQRILAESERAWGMVLASTVGLTDEDLDVKPPEGWTLRETIAHLAWAERFYFDAVIAALKQAQPEEAKSDGES
jgi:hypothetical protein